MCKAPVVPGPMLTTLFRTDTLFYPGCPALATEAAPAQGWYRSFVLMARFASPPLSHHHPSPPPDENLPFAR